MEHVMLTITVTSTIPAKPPTNAKRYLAHENDLRSCTP